jgi:hypothetical protein
VTPVASGVDGLEGELLMRSRLPVVMALPATALLLALVTAPAAAAATTTSDPTYPATPVPTENSPGEPPASAPNGPQPLGHAVADAATGLAVIRLLPGSVPGSSIIAGAPVPNQSAAEVGFGLSDARTDSESYLTYERSIAQSCPAGIAIAGDAPQLPGCLSQTALPDNAQPVNGGLNPPSTALDALLKVGLLDGSVHARYSDTLGPCVGTISDASTSLANISAVNVLPSLPGTSDAGTLTKDMSASNLAADQKQNLVDSLSKLAGPLSSLGGLLTGSIGATGSGSLVSVPNTLADRSVVRLIDIPGSANKAVQSVSTLQVASVKLLAGTPLETDLNVVSQPTLTVTSTGNPATSSIDYTAPIIQIVQAGKVLYTLDAAHPTQDIPIGIPLNVPNLPNLPVVGALLPNGQSLTSSIPVVDIGVLRLSIAELSKSQQSWTGGVHNAPFTGYQLGATARLLDLQVLPTAALGIPGLPAALAQVSLGEQVARAYAPSGGVQCGTTQVASTPPAHTVSTPKQLAWTNAAYDSVPLFWTATGLIMAGVILVAAFPGRPARAYAMAGASLRTRPRPTSTITAPAPAPAAQLTPETTTETETAEPAPEAADSTPEATTDEEPTTEE